MEHLYLPASMIPYYAMRGFNPPVCPGKFTFMNDAQTPLWDEQRQQFRFFALVNPDATFIKKTLNSNTFIGGESKWGEWRTDSDFENKKWLGFKLDGANQQRIPPDPNNAPLGTIATGSVIAYKGKYYWYASTGNNISDVSLWISEGLNDVPQYQGVVLSGNGADFRDFDAQVQPDGSLLATISCGYDGITWYSSNDGIKWNYLSIWNPPDIPDSLKECARMRTVNGITFLFFGANGWKDTSQYPDGDPAPRTYYSCGRFDGKNWIPGNLGRVEFGNGFYGAVPFQHPLTGKWYCISWQNQWSQAANMARPHVQGTMQIMEMTVSGALCDAVIYLKPVWDNPDAQFKIPRENMNFTATGNFSPLQFGTIDRGWLFWQNWGKLLANGEMFCLAANMGEHKFKEGQTRDDPAFGYIPKGFIMTKATDEQGRRGWNITIRGLGVHPEYDNKAYSAIYFLPQPGGNKDDEIWVWTDGDSCIVWAGDSRGNYNCAAFAVNWPLGGISIIESYQTQDDADGNPISANSYPSSCRWWSDDYPQPICQGGTSYWDLIGMFFDAATKLWRTEQPDNAYQLGIIKGSMDIGGTDKDGNPMPQAGKGLLLRRTMNEPESFKTAWSIPNMPAGSDYNGFNNAVATLYPDQYNSRWRLLGIAKAKAEQPQAPAALNSGGVVQDTPAGDYDPAAFARPFAVRPDDNDETKPSQTYYLMTDEQLEALIAARIVQTLQPSAEGAQNKAVVNQFWDAVNNQLVVTLRDGTQQRIGNQKTNLTAGNNPNESGAKK